jgi:serine/threonine-protein kinase
MEFVSGRPLEDWTKANYAFTPYDVVTIVAQVAGGLDYAHNRGVVHRDIKPANILVTDAGVSKVTDFGVAKKMDSKTLLTQVGTKLGSPYYMPPEQILESAVDGRADQFSLAVVAYELLAGRKPFYAEQIAGLLFQIVQADPPNLEQDRARLGPAVEPLLRALSKNPKARFASCTLFAWALAGALGCPIDIPQPEEPEVPHGLASLATRLRQWFESGLRKVFASR